MVWLGNLLVGLTSTVLTWFGLQLGKKTIYATAAVAAGLALTSACILAIKALTVGIVYALPGWMSGAIGAMIPGNAPACIGAIVGAKVAVWIYQYQMENLKIVSYIT